MANRFELLETAKLALAQGRFLGGFTDVDGLVVTSKPADDVTVAEILANRNTSGRNGAPYLAGDFQYRNALGLPGNEIVEILCPFVQIDPDNTSRLDVRSQLMYVANIGSAATSGPTQERAFWQRAEQPTAPPVRPGTPVRDALIGILDGARGGPLPAKAGGDTLRQARIEAVLRPEEIFEVVAYADPDDGTPVERRSLILRLKRPGTDDGTAGSHWDFTLLTSV